MKSDVSVACSVLLCVHFLLSSPYTRVKPLFSCMYRQRFCENLSFHNMEVFAVVCSVVLSGIYAKCTEIESLLRVQGCS